MAKTIVWDSPYQTKTLHPATGLVFERGVPRPVTDEHAEILLEKHTKPFLEGDNADIERLKIDKPHPNPFFGQQKHPYFSLVEDEKEVKASDVPVWANIAPSNKPEAA